MADYKPGVYRGKAYGQKGNVVVEVTVDEHSILDCKIVEHKEIRGIGWGLRTSPVEVIPPQIVKYQSLAVPYVNGGKNTSEAIIKAAARALTEAGADTKALRAVPTELPPVRPEETREVETVVFGAGPGGLAAAIELKRAGRDVVLVEAQGVTGGSAARSGGKLLAAGSDAQAKQGIYDTPELLLSYLESKGDGLLNTEKVKYFCDCAKEDIDWITEMGYHVQDVEAIHYRLLPWRVHNSPGGGGQTDGQGGEITTPMTQELERLGGEIIYNAPLESLVRENGVVCGAVSRCLEYDPAEKKYVSGNALTFKCKNVILATGGYSHNRKFVEEQYPYMAGYFTQTPSSNTGGGIWAARAIGAKYVQAPTVQTVYTSATCGVGINEEGGLWVNGEGRRCGDEDTYQFCISDKIVLTGSNVAWYITSGDEKELKRHPTVAQGVRGARSKTTAKDFNGDFWAESVEELAGKIKADPEVLKATVARYNELCDKGHDDDFNKPASRLYPVKGPKYYALKLVPCLSCTFGGLDANMDSEVLDNDGKVIPGLYATGECASAGMYGREYPTCGTSIGYSLLYGRVAARKIAGLPRP